MIQRQIQEAAYAAQQAVDRGDSVVVGVNRFATDERPTMETFALDPDVERNQIAGCRRCAPGATSRRGDPPSTPSRSAARGGDNLVPPIVAAVEAKATVGEIADTMRGVFGEFREVAVE